jgi:hypothetical protein
MPVSNELFDMYQGYDEEGKVLLQEVFQAALSRQGWGCAQRCLKDLPNIPGYNDTYFEEDFKLSLDRAGDGGTFLL